jgi:hypothetical protein
MIISHSRKFIFVKTMKTAGTSLEMALSKHCEPGDVLTPLIPEEECERQRVAGIGAQNFWRPLREYRLGARVSRIVRRRREFKFGEHSPAWQVRRAVGERTWSSYFKFAVVRNPFDRAVSRYYYTKKYFDETDEVELWDRRSFDQFLRYMPELINENWPMYTEKDEVVLDRMVRYERLEEDLGEVSRRIGLPGNIYDDLRTIRAKSDYRPRQVRPSDLFDDRQKELVAILCREEIAAFGYRYEDPALAPVVAAE